MCVLVTSCRSYVDLTRSQFFMCLFPPHDDLGKCLNFYQLCKSRVPPKESRNMSEHLEMHKGTENSCQRLYICYFLSASQQTSPWNQASNWGNGSSQGLTSPPSPTCWMRARGFSGTALGLQSSARPLFPTEQVSPRLRRQPDQEMGVFKKPSADS